MLIKRSLYRVFNLRISKPLQNLPKAIEVYKQRRVLEKLTDQELRDIGVSRGDAEREAARKFWDF